MGQAQPQVFANPQPMQSFLLPPQIDYSKISNLNQINHMHIYQISDNMFKIKRNCYTFLKIVPIIGICISLIMSIILFIVGGEAFTIFGAVFIVILIGHVILAFFNYYEINFILGENNITVEKQAIFRKKTINYISGQIQNVQLTCQFSQECEQLYRYKIDFTLNNNGTTSHVSYFKEACDSQIYTLEEIGYFNYVMNKHIQTKMRG